MTSETCRPEPAKGHGYRPPQMVPIGTLERCGNCRRYGADCKPPGPYGTCDAWEHK